MNTAPFPAASNFASRLIFVKITVRHLLLIGSTFTSFVFAVTANDFN